MNDWRWKSNLDYFGIDRSTKFLCCCCVCCLFPLDHNGLYQIGRLFSYFREPVSSWILPSGCTPFVGGLSIDCQCRVTTMTYSVWNMFSCLHSYQTLDLKLFFWNSECQKFFELSLYRMHSKLLTWTLFFFYRILLLSRLNLLVYTVTCFKT